MEIENEYAHKKRNAIILVCAFEGEIELYLVNIRGVCSLSVCTGEKAGF
jgi:hypothetical protein